MSVRFSQPSYYSEHFPFDDPDDIVWKEWKIIDHEVKTIASIIVFEFFLDERQFSGSDEYMIWQETEQFKWVREHALENLKMVSTTYISDTLAYRKRISVIAKLYEEDQLYFALKWQ